MLTNERLVYVVDDDDSVRRSAAFMLRHAGFKVEPVESGVAFLKLAKGAERGCVLLDVRMPEIDGLQVQQEMIKDGIDMPVVILTGHGDIEIAVQAMRAGAVNFLEKPYEKEALIAAMEEAFRRLEDSDLKEMAASEAKVRLACLTGREQDNPIFIYRANMMEKLRVRSLAEALRIGFAAERVDDKNGQPE